MPGRTNSDAIRELEQITARLVERVDNVRETMRKDLDALTKIVESSNLASGSDLKVLLQQISEVRAEIAVLKERHEQVRHMQEQTDRRRWNIHLLVLASFLTFLANIVVLILQRLR